MQSGAVARLQLYTPLPSRPGHHEATRTVVLVPGAHRYRPSAQWRVWGSIGRSQTVAVAPADREERSEVSLRFPWTTMGGVPKRPWVDTSFGVGNQVAVKPPALALSRASWGKTHVGESFPRQHVSREGRTDARRHYTRTTYDRYTRALHYRRYSRYTHTHSDRTPLTVHGHYITPSDRGHRY